METLFKFCEAYPIWAALCGLALAILLIVLGTWAISAEFKSESDDQKTTEIKNLLNRKPKL